MNLAGITLVCLDFLFSCQRADFRRKGGKSARPSRPCQAACFRSLAPCQGAASEPIPVDPETVTACVVGMKKIELRRCRGPRILGPARAVVNPSSRELLQLNEGGRYFPRSTAFKPALGSAKRRCVSQLPSAFQGTLSASGPRTTPLPQVLFHDFRKASNSPAAREIGSMP